MKEVLSFRQPNPKALRANAKSVRAGGAFKVQAVIGGNAS